MKLWQRWVQCPQSLWVRKALFQIHLWVGLDVTARVKIDQVDTVQEMAFGHIFLDANHMRL